MRNFFLLACLFIALSIGYFALIDEKNVIQEIKQWMTQWSDAPDEEIEETPDTPETLDTPEDIVEKTAPVQQNMSRAGYGFYDLDGEQLEVPYAMGPESLSEEILDSIQMPNYDIPITEWYFHRKPTFLAPAGSTWYVYEQTAGWVRIGEDKWVQLTDNMQSVTAHSEQVTESNQLYYQQDEIRQKVQPPVGTVTILTDNLNVRDYHSVEGNVIGKASAGTVYNVYGIAPSGWYALDDRVFISNDPTFVSYQAHADNTKAYAPVHQEVQAGTGSHIGEVIFKNAAFVYFRDGETFQFSYQAAPNEKHYIVDTYYMDWKSETFLITNQGYYILLDYNVHYTEY